ncbi:MAG: hypothetical protein GWP10_09005, partial [Nitrospiraceae bacterium]|nr:hypothetical protein [Nitrospiraceae bacterium]
MNNIDGWTLVLNVLKEKDKASSVVLKMLVPVGINNKALLLYSNKEFVRIIFKEKVESLSPLIESITGLHPELTEKNGRRIKVPIIEKDEKIEIIARLKRIIFRNKDFYILSFLTDNGDEITAKGQSVLHLAEDMQYRLNGRWTKHPK